MYPHLKPPYQGNRPTYDGRKFQEEVRKQSRETHREEWNRSQDQSKFSHKDNKCLHCASDHEAHNCPTRQQHQAPTASNHARGTGIYQNTNQFNSYTKGNDKDKPVNVSVTLNGPVSKEQL